MMETISEFPISIIEMKDREEQHRVPTPASWPVQLQFYTLL